MRTKSPKRVTRPAGRKERDYAPEAPLPGETEEPRTFIVLREFVTYMDGADLFFLFVSLLTLGVILFGVLVSLL